MVVWMDGIVFKVRESGKIINKTVYLCVGLNNKGYKEVLGMWIGKTGSSSFWMSVHQIRNSCKYVVWKDMKEFTADMKEIYTSVNREQAASALAAFEQKWGSKYRHAVQSWHRNWDDLTAFFDFPVEIRTIFIQQIL